MCICWPRGPVGVLVALWSGIDHHGHRPGPGQMPGPAGPVLAGGPCPVWLRPWLRGPLVVASFHVIACIAVKCRPAWLRETLQRATKPARCRAEPAKQARRRVFLSPDPKPVRVIGASHAADCPPCCKPSRTWRRGSRNESGALRQTTLLQHDPCNVRPCRPGLAVPRFVTGGLWGVGVAQRKFRTILPSSSPPTRLTRSPARTAECPSPPASVPRAS
jgi:hypothetical protein